MSNVPYPNYDLARCRDMGTDAFYTDTDGVYADAQYINIGLTKRICGDCIIKDECLTWALHHEVYGIWGGTGPPQREKLRKQLGIIYKPIGESK